MKIERYYSYGWNVQEYFVELFMKRFPKLKSNTSFPSSNLWKDLYKILISCTVNRFDYKGFPTRTSYKKHNNTFPNTCTADKDDERVANIMNNFLIEHGDNVKEIVDNYVSGVVCNVNSYVWSSDLSTTGNYESSSNVKEVEVLTTETVKENTKESTKETTKTGKESLKRKKEEKEPITHLTIGIYREKVLKCLEMDKQANDLKMTTQLLEEMEEILQPNKKRLQELEKEVEEEDEFFRQCMDFFKRKMRKKKEEYTVMDENYKILSKLHDDISKYVVKRKEKLKTEVEEKQIDLIRKIASLLAED